MIVMLHAIMLVAQPVVERESGCCPETVLGIERPVCVAIAARVVCRAQRWRHRASRRLDYVSENIGMARKYAIRVDPRVEGNQRATAWIASAVHEISHPV